MPPFPRLGLLHPRDPADATVKPRDVVLRHLHHATPSSSDARRFRRRAHRNSPRGRRHGVLRRVGGVVRSSGPT